MMSPSVAARRHLQLRFSIVLGSRLVDADPLATGVHERLLSHYAARRPDVALSLFLDDLRGAKAPPRTTTAVVAAACAFRLRASIAKAWRHVKHLRPRRSVTRKDQWQ